MNSKAILATLVVLGSSTAALADNYDHRGGDDQSQRDRGRDQGQRDRDRDGDRDGWKRPAWTVLASSDRLAAGRATTRVYNWKKFSTLELAATRGESDIDAVRIQFANGRTKLVEVHQDIGADDAPSLTVDLDGARAIRSITVLGHASRGAAFKILAA